MLADKARELVTNKVMVDLKKLLAKWTTHKVVLKSEVRLHGSNADGDTFKGS